MRAIVSGVLLLSILLVSITSSSVPQATLSLASGENGREMVPMVEASEMMMMMNESRRKLSSFQICALCTCCSGGGGGGGGGGRSRSRSYCLASPCCYAINCNIPNRPFGFCSFTPKTCNCFRCHL